MADRGEEIFNEMQAKQSKLAKKILLGVLSGLGIVFVILGIVFFCLSGSINRELAIAFLVYGLFMLALGIILYFAIPTKYNYQKYKARVEKYGIMNMFDINAKIAELEERIEELEKRN